MSWQGQWAGQSAGRWYGYTAQPAPEVPAITGGVSYTFRPLRPEEHIAWLEARLVGHGDLAGIVGSGRKRRARKHREEEFLLRRLH